MNSETICCINAYFLLCIYFSRTGPSHLVLAGDLMGTATDDTLHTPHIFPHLPDDSNNTGLYSASTERTTLTTSRLSSDEGSNQLTVVKCMSSSVEDNLSSVGLNEHDKDDKHYRKVTVLVERKIKKSTDSGTSSKTKLTRQNSIDLPDDLNGQNLRFEPLRNEDSKKEDKHCERTNDVLRNRDDRVMQIPVISISETPKSNASLQDIEFIDVNNQANEINVNLGKHRTQKPPSIGELVVAKKESKFLDVKSCLKGNYSKLISQKSIDMALVHFTNEAQCKMMDLNNISIEDLPDSTSVIKESVSSLSSQISQDSNRPADEINVQTISKRRRLMFSKSKSTSRNTSNDIEKIVEPNKPKSDQEMGGFCIETLGGNITSENSGYELMLKWPDGKKIYLKEVHRDGNETAEQRNVNETLETVFQSVPSPSANEIHKPNVRQKLKDMINCNNDRQILDGGSNIILNPLSLQTPIILPENYMVLPQISSLDANNIPVSTVLTSNIQLLSFVSPKIQNHQSVLIPNKMADYQTVNHVERNASQPVIRTISGGNIYSGDNAVILPNQGLKTLPQKGPSTNTYDPFNLNSLVNGSTSAKQVMKKLKGNSDFSNDNAKKIKTEANSNLSKNKTNEVKGNQNEEIRRQLVQERNRAAVSRYRYVIIINYFFCFLYGRIQ